MSKICEDFRKKITKICNGREIFGYILKRIFKLILKEL